MVITKKVYIPQNFYLNVTKNKTPVFLSNEHFVFRKNEGQAPQTKGLGYIMKGLLLTYFILNKSTTDIK